MTRKEMITACIEEQIKRGIIPEEHKEKQIAWRLKGFRSAPAMTLEDCKSWYNAVFNK